MYTRTLLLKLLCTVLLVIVLSIGMLSLQIAFAHDCLYCKGDFDCDRDVDGSDLAIFAKDFGKAHCTADCAGDFDGDADVDSSDLALFAVHFGRTDCPNLLNFTHVPQYPNPGKENLEGTVTCIDPGDYKDYRIAVYIRVEDVWWIKPYENSPLTTIRPDGTWTCRITTNGNDRCATEVAAYLLPLGVEPEICVCCHALPIHSQAIACIRQSIGPPQRTISFAGYNWQVKRTDCPLDPEPNYFSDREEDVWVDEEGLHLTIGERDGVWYCTEVVLDASFGYGTYMFQTHGRVDMFDPMMVLGLFTFDAEAYLANYRELDIEFARWGNDSEDTNAQYVVKPCNECPGCGDHCTRFRVDLTDEASDLTHYMVWQSGRVEFRTYYGKHGNSPPANALAHKWVFVGDYIPEPGNENVRFNFWLHQGNAPNSGQGDEVVITDFAWQQEPIVWAGE